MDFVVSVIKTLLVHKEPFSGLFIILFNEDSVTQMDYSVFVVCIDN